MPLACYGKPTTHPLQKNQLFLKARARLVNAGWTPIKQHVASDTDSLEGVEIQLLRKGIAEFDSCSTDSSRCIFYYRNGDKCLRIDTIGEQVKHMKVTQWSNECPTPP